MGFICLIILINSFLLIRIVSNSSNSKGYAITRPLAVCGMLLFSLLVGFRYNMGVDKDFINYWNVAQYGSDYHEYHRFEVIPKLFADIVHYLNMPASAWFILMGASLIYFTLFSACRISNRFMPYVFCGLLLIYLSFDMNVMRQGVALSIFLCAVTYIGEKNWKKFILFMILAFGFHKSSIIWSLSYLLAFLNWEKHSFKIFVFLAAGSALIFKALDYLIPYLSFIISALGQGEISTLSDMDLLMMDEKGSGIGVIIRYIRWGVLLYFIPKIAKKYNDNQLYCLYALFIMGVVFDVFSMYSIILSRIALYPQVTELLLYPYVLRSCKNALIKIIAFFQILFLTYVLYQYLDNWQFVTMF